MAKNNNRRNGNKNSNYKSGRRTPNNKEVTKGKDKEFVEESMSSRKSLGGSCNDPKWYKKSEQLANDAARINFVHRTGEAFPFTQKNISGTIQLKVDTSKVTTMPGVMAVNYIPSLGKTGNVAGPWKAAFGSMYNYLVHANSRNTSYSMYDLGAIVTAGMQVYAAIAHAIRIYGVAMIYDQRNRYLPQALLQSLGVAGPGSDWNSYRTRLNMLINRASQIWMPNTLPVLDRWMWMNTYVYLDSPDPRAQMYVYVPKVFYKYDPVKYDTGSALVPVEFISDDTSKYVSGEGLLNIIEKMEDAIFNDDDAMRIMGDILKAYGPERLVTINTIHEDYTVLPTYNEEVLTQIHNSVAIPRPAADWVQTHPAGSASYFSELPAGTKSRFKIAIMDTPLLDLGHEDPTVDEILVATRMTQNGYTKNVKTADAWPMYTINGSERVYDYTICRYDSDVDNIVKTVFWSYYADSAEGTYETDLAHLVSKFNMAPFVYLFIISGDTPNYAFTLDAIIGDTTNAVPLSPAVMERLHEVCIMSEWDVPITLN